MKRIGLSLLRSRGPLIGLLVVAAAVPRLCGPAAPDATIEGVAEMLANASSTHVSPKDIVWEPSDGAWADTTVGRPALFLGAQEKGGPKDVYRGFVRVTWDGKPVGVTQLRNVTDTPLGDDVALRLRGNRAIFATVAFGRIQGVSVLDVEGIRHADRPSSWFDRALLSVTSFQQTGSFKGLGRSDIVLDVPSKFAKLKLDVPLLTVDVGARSRSVVYDTEKRTLTGVDGGQAFAARALPKQYHPKPLIHWAVDTVRAEVGPEPIAWLEQKVFGAKDAVKRATHALGPSSDQEQLKDASGKESEAPRAEILSASGLNSKGSWPPPPIPSLWKETKPGEGQWQPSSQEWVKKLPGIPRNKKAPSYFYTTFIRPDKKRPYSTVHLVAMDMRRLELGMEAGFEDPKPLTGPPGVGRLPRDKDTLDRVVATFNGAFKTTHGKYGMMVNKRVLLPPVKAGATVIVTDERRVGLGSWPQDQSIPDNIVSFRQNLDPLVEDGVANPTGRNIWGWQLAGTSIMTERTALCVTSAGHLYYAWGKEVDGPTLGKALRQAGCSYGMHLDMNPRHCGFVFTDILDMKRKQFRLKRLHEEMGIMPDKFVKWSAKDFFYVMVRDLAPADPSRIVWKPDPGAQPPPAFVPGVFRGTLKMGSLKIELTSFQPDRVQWSLRAGTKEYTTPSSGPAKLELGSADKKRVIAAINLANATTGVRPGLAFGTQPVLPPRPGFATVAVTKSKQLIVSLDPPSTEQLASAQLPILAKDGKLTPAARETGSMRRRGAMCVTANGRIMVAIARHDTSDTLADALLRAGCKTVVELDRGSQHPAFVHRAETETPPMTGYETTVLYALGQQMRPFAFRWKASGAAPSTKPTGYDWPPKGSKAAASASP